MIFGPSLWYFATYISIPGKRSSGMGVINQPTLCSLSHPWPTSTWSPHPHLRSCLQMLPTSKILAGNRYHLTLQPFFHPSWIITPVKDSCTCLIGHNHHITLPYFCSFVYIKLFLPVLDGYHIICGCGTVVDTHGIHFFNCHKFHPKTHFHNRICDTDHLCISKNGIHAGILCSRSDITTARAFQLGPLQPYVTPSWCVSWSFVHLHWSPTLAFCKSSNWCAYYIIGLPLTPSFWWWLYSYGFHHYSPPVPWSGC